MILYDYICVLDLDYVLEFTIMLTKIIIQYVGGWTIVGRLFLLDRPPKKMKKLKRTTNIRMQEDRERLYPCSLRESVMHGGVRKSQT